MFSDHNIIMMRICVILALPAAILSCSPLARYADMASMPEQLSITLPDDAVRTPAVQEEEVRIQADSVTEDDGPVIMKAIRDSETGEMTATDVIRASKVVARFRNIAERSGRISFEFDITVPETLISSGFQLRFYPVVETGGESRRLDPVFITGSAYRRKQLRGYEKYREFLESIITDTMAFVRKNQLERFIARYFPETFAMKNDSSVIPEPMAENLFGINQRMALEHYTRQASRRRNYWKMTHKDEMFRKLVRSPVEKDVVLDTVMSAGQGSLIYRYSHSMASPPGLRKLFVSLAGAVYRDGDMVTEMPSPDKLTFYISSLSSLADNTPRYLVKVVDRTVTDNTEVLLDFGKGSARLDTLLEGNSSELGRIRQCFRDIGARKDLVLDSIIVTASCSPEGSLAFNTRLAEARAESVREYVLACGGNLDTGLIRSESVPENWEGLVRLVANDTLLPHSVRKRIVRIAEEEDKDAAESRIAVMPEYRYLREKIYPRLRTVNFSFFMHRPDIRKDTIHTRVLDTVYMRGLEALRNLDYKKAAELLSPYRDYNAALALASSGYDSHAIGILSSIGNPDARTDYLTAVLLSRAGEYDEALEYFRRSVRKDPSMVHRANLDPELSEIAGQADTVTDRLPGYNE